MKPATMLTALKQQLRKLWKSHGRVNFRMIPPCNCGTEECGQPYWVIIAHPPLLEIYGGSNDGCVVSPGFNINITDICNLFDKVESIKAESGCSHCLDPLIQIRGTFMNSVVGIGILFKPPKKAKVIGSLHHSTGKITLKEKKK
jgi:hypothetical protein